MTGAAGKLHACLAGQVEVAAACWLPCRSTSASAWLSARHSVTETAEELRRHLLIMYSITLQTFAIVCLIVGLKKICIGVPKLLKVSQQTAFVQCFVKNKN